MKHTFLLTIPALALMLAVAPALAQTTSNDGAAVDQGGAPPLVTNDADFVRLATSSNLLEILSSEQAAQRAQTEAVRDFAARMVTDHHTATARLAEVSGMPAPDPAADPSAMLDPRHAALLTQLDSATDFDAAYVQLQLQAHEEAVALFQDYATNGQEGAVKDFAEATLPTLQQHLEAAQALTVPNAGP